MASLLGAALGGMLLALLDQTIVGTALPRITAELGGTAGYGWVVTAYLLGVTASGPVYGRLSDRHGRRPLLMIGMAVFLTGSALCASATSMGLLVAYRSLQGLGAGALMPLCLALAAELFPATQRAKVQGAVGAVMAFSYVAGPFAGGVLTDHAGWRWIFLVNLPIGAVVLFLIATRLPRTPHRTDRGAARPDYAGVLLFTGAVAALLIGLTQPAVRPLTLTLAALLTPIFLTVQARTAEPLIPLALFRRRAYTTASIAAFGGAFDLYSLLVFLPRYFRPPATPRRRVRACGSIRCCWAWWRAASSPAC